MVRKKKGNMALRKQGLTDSKLRPGSYTNDIRTYQYYLKRVNPEKARLLRDLGHVIMTKYSISDIVQRTKWEGVDAHKLVKGELALKLEDIMHIEQMLGVSIRDLDKIESMSDVTEKDWRYINEQADLAAADRARGQEVTAINDTEIELEEVEGLEEKTDSSEKLG